MRAPLSLVVLSSLCLTAPAFVQARADTITVTVSATASGSFDAQVFQGRTVTFTGETTTAQVTACENGTASASCSYFSNQFSREIKVPYSSGTVTVQGFGTYSTVGQDTLDFFAGTFDINQMRLLTAGGLSFGVTAQTTPYDYNFGQSVAPWQGGPEGSYADNNCQDGPASQCPVFAATTGGGLVLTDVFQQVNGDILLSSSAPVPEPGAWVLVGTGLAGLGSLRRRWMR